MMVMRIVLTGDDYDFDKDYNAVADLLIKILAHVFMFMAHL